MILGPKDLLGGPFWRYFSLTRILPTWEAIWTANFGENKLFRPILEVFHLPGGLVESLRSNLRRITTNLGFWTSLTQI